MPRRAKGDLVKHPVWSALDKKVVDVKIAADRIPELKYIFDPAKVGSVYPTQVSLKLKLELYDDG